MIENEPKLADHNQPELNLNVRISRGTTPVPMSLHLQESDPSLVLVQWTCNNVHYRGQQWQSNLLTIGQAMTAARICLVMSDTGGI